MMYGGEVEDKYILLSLHMVSELSLVDFLYALVFSPILRECDMKEKDSK